MVNKSLVALVMVAHESEKGKTLPPSYFLERGLAEEGTDLFKKKFIEMKSKDKLTGYSLTNIGKSVLEELDEFYEISYTAHIF
jgi:hypothetical protein